VTVFKHPTGRWSYDFVLNRKRFQKSGFPTKQEARDAETDTRRRLQTLNATFLRLCSARLEDLKLRRSSKHYQENLRLLKKLMERWGAKNTITRDDVETYMKEVATENKMLANRELRLIKALFGYGVTRGWLGENPTRGIERFPATPRPRYVPPVEDVAAVLAVANQEQRDYLLVVINTMARVREINRLKWADIGADYLILRTRKAKCSDLTERRIPINQTLKEILGRLLRKGEFVFQNPRTGKEYDYRKGMLKSLCRKTRVSYFSFHCLRHLGASRLVKGGVALTDIQKLLGHQRPTTTDIYLHSIGDGLADAVTKLEGL
jgi:integrase